MHFWSNREHREMGWAVTSFSSCSVAAKSRADLSLLGFGYIVPTFKGFHGHRNKCNTLLAAELFCSPPSSAHKQRSIRAWPWVQHVGGGSP